MEIYTPDSVILLKGFRPGGELVQQRLGECVLLLWELMQERPKEKECYCGGRILIGVSEHLFQAFQRSICLFSKNEMKLCKLNI